MRGQAELVLALRCRAFNDAAREGLALEWELLIVTVESPVATVPVFQNLAVAIGFAVAGNRGAGTGLLLADIAYSAGITVVAVGLVGFKDTAAIDVAKVIGAGIIVVAFDRRTLAEAVEADFCHGAGITVVTLHPLLRFEDTALVWLALVQGTGVAVVTGPFVYLSVAVVVAAVAKLFIGHHCIAIGQAIFGAGPVARADAEVVAHFAGGAKTGGYGELAARAGAGHLYTVGVAVVFGGIDIQAVAPLGTEDFIGA